MAVIITKQADIDAYFESDAVNQSTLKDLIGGFDSYMFKKHKEEESKNEPTPSYFLIGGAVDTILTGEEGEFENKYYVSQLDKKPSDVECKIVEQVFHEISDLDDEEVKNIDFEACYDMILLAADDNEWQKRWKAETRFNKLVLAGQDYFEDMKKAVGKEIISLDMKNTIDKIVMSLTTNPKTKKYFDRQSLESVGNADFYYQLPIYFTYEGVECKALLDLLIVIKDEKGNIVAYEPIDLKTMSGNTLQFIDKVKQHRYDIQAAWYHLAIIKHFNIKDISIIKPFKFIVESTTNVGTPLVYKISQKTLIIGTVGLPEGKLKLDGGRELNYKRLVGFNQLMSLYQYYEEQGWKQDKILDENSDIIEIDFNRGIV